MKQSNKFFIGAGLAIFVGLWNLATSYTNGTLINFLAFPLMLLCGGWYILMALDWRDHEAPPKELMDAFNSDPTSIDIEYKD